MKSNNKSEIKIELNEKALEILQDMADGQGTVAIKRELFHALYGISQMTLSVHIMSDAESLRKAGYISQDTADSLYIIKNLYDLFDNLEIKS